MQAQSKNEQALTILFLYKCFDVGRRPSCYFEAERKRIIQKCSVNTQNGSPRVSRL